ncbi:hypothetical protein [Streptomyces sp. NBC_00091]|uniref:hypothetical protein n=1 Tax=Streptomyces sp. NBC_00091 TaxID=2975648 RepID=UPI00225C3735|nr:hypothetical protein [Streptomyces sp. NBC_00091]MCX5380408.1 hypothetical protein [Streptomyces sp. NBC_00091]
MHHVRSFIHHALRSAADLLSWHPSPEAHFLGQVLGDLAANEAVRLWVRITARVYWTRFTARLHRRGNR